MPARCGREAPHAVDAPDRRVTKGLKQMSDSGAPEAIVDEALRPTPRASDEFRAGAGQGFSTRWSGQVMKSHKRQGQPAQAGELLRSKLAG